MEKGDKKKPIKPKTKRKYTKKSTNDNTNINKINIKIGETAKPKRKYTRKPKPDVIIKQHPVKSITKGQIITHTIPTQQYDLSNISHLYQTGQPQEKQPEKQQEIKITPPKMEMPQPEVIIKKPEKPQKSEKPKKSKKGNFNVPVEIYVPSKPKEKSTEFINVNEPQPELLRIIPEEKPKKPIKIKKEKEIYLIDFFEPSNQEQEEVNVLSLQQPPKNDLLDLDFTYKTQDIGFINEPDEGQLLSIQDEKKEIIKYNEPIIEEEEMPFLSIKDLIDGEFEKKSQINELLGEMTSKIEIKQLLDDTIREVETRMTTKEEDPIFVIEKEERQEDIKQDLTKYTPITSIPAGKIYNTETGRFVSIDGAKYKKDRFTAESEKYTDDLMIINEVRKSGLVNRGKYKKE